MIHSCCHLRSYYSVMLLQSEQMSHFINKVVLWDHHEILMLTLTPTLHPSESGGPLEMEICTSQLNHTDF